MTAGAEGRRLLLVSHTGLMSGAETVLVRAAEAAPRHGFSVRAAVPRGPLAEALRSMSVDIVDIPELKLPAGPRVLGATALGLRSAVAARRLRAVDVDVVVCNGLLALPALRLARPAAPVAWLVHDVQHRRDQFRLLRAVGGVADLAVAVSDAVAKPLRDRGIGTVVVRNGTPWPPKAATSGPKSPPVVGCAALLTPWKGQEILLEAMARLGRPEVRVELAGGVFPKDHAYVQRLRRRAAEPDLAGRVRFLGHVDEILATVGTWTVAVIASVDPEAAPLNLLEAMSIGVPVVATDHGGTPEVIGEAGLLVPPGDADAMAVAIADLLDDHSLWRRCSQAGPRAISASLSLERWEEEMMGALKRLSSPGPESSRAGGLRGESPRAGRS